MGGGNSLVLEEVFKLGYLGTVNPLNYSQPLKT